MLAKVEWAHLIPHAGAMSLLDEVITWDARRLHARSASHRADDNPLRADGVLHAVNLCEYAAQAMALHGGLVAPGTGGASRPGWLVALREVELQVLRVDDLPGWLQIHVECLLATVDSLQYGFHVGHRGRLLARGRAVVVLQNH